MTKKIADQTLGQLEREGIFVFPETMASAADITNEQMVLRSKNNCYCTCNVMGFLGYGQEHLIIESRFSTGRQDNFFQYLLEKVLALPNVVNLNTNASQEYHLFDWTALLLPYFLKKAMRKGVFKTYVRHKYNDNHVKGVIDVARHVRTNTPFIGKVAYNQREFAYDNQLTELIRHTIEFIKAKPYGQRLLQSVKMEVGAIIAATNKYEFYARSKVIAANKKNPVRHAYYHEYGTLQKLCLMILQHDKYQIGLGVHQVHGILFDGSWLWEEYVNLLIGDKFHHPQNRSNKGAQELFSKVGGKQVGSIYPDFISHNLTPRIIADTKYKPQGNIYGKDYLQVLAYMFRFDVKKGFYLYPESGKSNDSKLFLNSGSTYDKNVVVRSDISLIKCGLKIPCDIENYDEFKIAMAQNEAAFKQAILD
ncbi:hypothetical protein AB0Y04_01755 [Loigolactobacillus coryniformis]